MPLSISQANRLGERLRAGSSSAEDLALLAEYQEQYRELFEDTRDRLVAAARAVLGDAYTPPSGRFKQLRSIAEKLRRESTRLAQLQDVVGLRIVVPDVQAQDAVTAKLCSTDEWRVSDLRTRPHHGYRAVHAIRKTGRYRVEVQIRTERQHAWAEFSEMLDRTQPGLKYGTGPADVQEMLLELSRQLVRIEEAEARGDLETRDELARQTALSMLVAAVIAAILGRKR